MNQSALAAYCLIEGAVVNDVLISDDSVWFWIVSFDSTSLIIQFSTPYASSHFAPIAEQSLQIASLVSAARNMAQQNIIGSAVRRIRVEKELTQDAFAARCQLAGWDLSRETLSKIEACLRRVNDAEVMMLAKILGCKITDLFPTNTKAILPVLRHSK